MAAAKILCGGTTLYPRRQSATFATNKPYSRPKLLYSTTSIHLQPPKIIRAFSVTARGRDDDNKFLPRSIVAIDFSGRRVQSNQTPKSLQALAANTNARLQVYDDDDDISLIKLFCFRIQSLLENAKNLAMFLIRFSFILPFGASNVAAYAVAILLFIITFGCVESIAMKTNLRSGYIYSAEFIDCIFSYVFGDGDPNQGIEEKRWKMIELYIALNGCVVTAEEIAPYLLDPETTMKMNDESYMLPLLHRFNGQPIVDEYGNILYHFPSLIFTSLPTRTSRGNEYAGRYVDRGIKVDKFLDEQRWKFSKLDDESLDFVAGILRYNLFSVAFVGKVLWPLNRESFYCRCLFVHLLFPMYAIYAVSFNVISSIRWVWIQKRNAEIIKRNEARKELAKSLESPNLYLMQKLVSARAVAQKVFIGNDRIVSSKFTDDRPDGDELSCTETETGTRNRNENKKWIQWAARKLQF